MAGVIAQRYGVSLFEAAKEEDLLDKIREDLGLAEGLIKENPEFLRLLETPMIPKEERRKVLEQALGQAVHQYTLNFLDILVDRGRISLFYEICTEYRRLYDEDKGIQEAEVTTAAPINQALEQKLRKKLEEITGKTIRLSCKVDAKLLGGVVVNIGNRQMDSSVKSRLEELGRQLAAIS